MNLPDTSNHQVTEVKLLGIARELAIDVLPLDQILEIHHVSVEQWEGLRENSRFQDILQEEIAAYKSATNTGERVKLKAAGAIEQWLPELYARIHDRSETLSSKVEAGKLLARLSGIGERAGAEAGGGERFQVTINLGDQKVSFEKQVTPRVIEGDALDG